MPAHPWEARADQIRREDERLRNERLDLACATCDAPLNPLMQDVLKCPTCERIFCRACYDHHDNRK